MKSTARLIIALFSAITIVGCSENKEYETSFCALADVSGTYAREKANIVQIIKAGILPEMVPGDSLFLITIDSNSYSETNLQTKITLDYRPSEVNIQKLAFSRALNDFAKDGTTSQHTDISGAMMLCSDYLKDTDSGNQMMFIFSDMAEELPAGVVREFSEHEFSNIDIAAMNVIKLNKDSLNPEIYRNRLKSWQEKVDAADARSWSTIIDATKIQEYIYEVKS